MEKKKIRKEKTKKEAEEKKPFEEKRVEQKKKSKEEEKPVFEEKEKESIEAEKQKEKKTVFEKKKEEIKKEEIKTGKAIILNFRRGRHTQRANQFLIAVDGIDSRARASKMIGKRIVWTSPAGKKIHGKITNTHGNKGVLRARFSRGLPGTVLGKRIDVLEK